MQKFSYINQMNGFLTRISVDALPANAVMLYLILFHKFNRSCWRQEWMKFTLQQLMAFSHVGSPNTVYSMRSLLKELGYIDYRPAQNGNRSQTEYRLLPLSSANSNAITISQPSGYEFSDNDFSENENPHNNFPLEFSKNENYRHTDFSKSENCQPPEFSKSENSAPELSGELSAEFSKSESNYPVFMGFHGYFVSSTLATFYIHEHAVIHDELVFLSLLHCYPRNLASSALPCGFFFPFACEDNSFELTVIRLENYSRHGLPFLILELLHGISDAHKYLRQLME